MRPLQAPYGLHGGHVECITVTNETSLCFMCLMRAKVGFECSCAFCERGISCSADVNKKRTEGKLLVWSSLEGELFFSFTAFLFARYLCAR